MFTPLSATIRSMIPDIGYILGHQNEYEELRHSLRSLRFVDHGQVWIAGAPPPDWIRNVNWIPVVQDGPRDGSWVDYWPRKTNQRTNILAICDHQEVAQKWIFMNDDFMFVKPIDGELPPPPHIGTFTETHGNMQKVAGAYQKLYYWWKEHPEFGVDEPLHVPEHVPMVVDKTLLADWMRDVWHIHGFPVASLWANNAKVPAYRGKDFILKRKNHEETWPEEHWAISTVNRSFYDWPVGDKLRALHSEPSPYER
jgi:hypothetical protein